MGLNNNPMTPKVKICGITNLDDALLACKYGADLLGFNFYKKSPRYISPEKAGQIIKKLPPFVLSVGIFVDAPKTAVKKIIRDCNIRIVQFHGSESPLYCKEFLKSAVVIKAFCIHKKNDLSKIDKYKVNAVLLDTFVKGERGGTGKTFDWNLAKAAKKLHPYIILSGGLNPKNIKQAVKKVSPYAIDTASGVEKSPGIKDAKLMKEFIEKCRLN